MFSRTSFVSFHLMWSSFTDGRLNSTNESILHAPLRETKKEVGIGEDKVEILEKLGPPARSLWPQSIVLRCELRVPRPCISVK